MRINSKNNKVNLKYGFGFSTGFKYCATFTKRKKNIKYVLLKIVADFKTLK